MNISKPIYQLSSLKQSKHINRLWEKTCCWCYLLYARGIYWMCHSTQQPRPLLFYKAVFRCLERTLSSDIWEELGVEAQACPSGSRPWGRPRTRWRDYLSAGLGTSWCLPGGVVGSGRWEECLGLPSQTVDPDNQQKTRLNEKLTVFCCFSLQIYTIYMLS